MTSWRRHGSTRTTPQDCRKNMDSAFREFRNCRALLEAAWFDVKEADRRHSELKRKAEEAQTRTFLRRECIRRATSDHAKAEEVLNNSVACLGTLAKDTAATPAPTCGVFDRESNERQYLKKSVGHDQRLAVSLLSTILRRPC